MIPIPEEEAYDWGGITLYHSGGLSGYEFIVSAIDDLEKVKTRYFGVAVQLWMNSTIFAVFVRNLYHALRMVINGPRRLAPWCCFIQASLGVAFGVIALTFALPTNSSCRLAVWFSNFCYPVSNICIALVLLQKAWLANNKNNLLIVVGLILLIPQPISTYIVWVHSPTFIYEDAGCVFVYPRFYPWLKFGIDIPINIVLSCAFLKVVFTQKRTFGSAIWVHLTKDGLVYMFSVILSNFICALIAAAHLAGNFSDMFFIYDWVITSYLLIAHDKSLRRALSQSSRPKTHFQRYNFEKTIHAGGISQIATMPDYTLVSEDTSRMDTQPDTK